MVRLNITIPEDVAEQLHQIRNKSQFIARAVAEKFNREKRQRLEKAMIDGYKEAAAEDRRLGHEWDTATREGWE